MTPDKRSGPIRVRRYQIEMMIKEMEQNPLLNNCKFSSSFTSATRNQEWNVLSQKLNSAGGAIKSVKCWQKTWTDKKCEVKKRHAIVKAERLKTGKENDELKLTQLEERILLLIGPSAAEGPEVEEEEPMPEEDVISKVENSPGLPTSESFMEESNKTDLDETVPNETPSHLPIESSLSESPSLPFCTAQTKEKQKTNSPEQAKTLLNETSHLPVIESSEHLVHLPESLSLPFHAPKTEEKRKTNSSDQSKTVLNDSHLPIIESSAHLIYLPESLSLPFQTPKTEEKQKTSSSVLKSDFAQVLAEGQTELAMALKECAAALQKQNELTERALEIKKRKVEALERALQIKKLKLDALLLKL